jgi:hypothetical protein
MLAWAYPKARQLATSETGLGREIFPEACPWTMAQLQDEDFLPEA